MNFKKGDIVSYNGNMYEVLQYGQRGLANYSGSAGDPTNLWVIQKGYNTSCFFPKESHYLLQLIRRAEVKSNKPQWF